MNIKEKLEDLLVQATKERSHYYVASVCRDAVSEIERLQNHIDFQQEIIGYQKEALIKTGATLQRAVESFALIADRLKST